MAEDKSAERKDEGGLPEHLTDEEAEALVDGGVAEFQKLGSNIRAGLFLIKGEYKGRFYSRLRDGESYKLCSKS